MSGPTKGRVFVPQEPMRRKGRDLVPLYNITPAALYGDLIPLLGSSRLPAFADGSIQVIKMKLCNFDDDDYILMIGDLIAIAGAVHFAALANRGQVNILKWEKRLNGYVKSTLNLR